MEIEVNGVRAIGITVAPFSSNYVITGETDERIELLRINTCHFEKIIENVKKKFEFHYWPQPIERESICPLEISAYDVDGQNSWAFIAFDRHENLASTLTCNGATKKTGGVSLCQSREGLVQEIEFDVEVQFKKGRDTCYTPETKDNKKFEFKMSPDRCVYVFYAGGKLHRMMTLGYQDFLLRKI
jgi:hypothetical protein